MGLRPRALPAQPGLASDVVVRALMAFRHGPDPQTAIAHAEIVATLTAHRDRWRTLAKAAMPMADDKPVRRGTDPMGRRSLHTATRCWRQPPLTCLGRSYGQG